MGLIVVETGKRSAIENMALDEALLADIEHEDDMILHLYEWEKDAATYGHFLDPADYLNMQEVERLGLQLAKRPTGGGIIFHLTDLAFSVLVPAKHPTFSLNPLDNYHTINSKVLQAITQFSGTPLELLPEENAPELGECKHFCMAKPTKYDLMLGGKKIGGAAQRKTKEGYLHQGSIYLAALPDAYLSAVLKEGSPVLEGMKQHGLSLLPSDWTPAMLADARNQLTLLIKNALGSNE